MDDHVIVGGIYEHFRGGKYVVIAEACEHDDKERSIPQVIYKDVESGKTWIQPAVRFIQMVRMSDGTDIERFTLLGQFAQPEVGEYIGVDYAQVAEHAAVERAPIVMADEEAALEQDIQKMLARHMPAFQAATLATLVNTLDEAAFIGWLVSIDGTSTVEFSDEREAEAPAVYTFPERFDEPDPHPLDADVTRGLGEVDLMATAKEA